MTSVLVCLWLKISSCTRLLYFLPHKSAFPWEAVRHNKNPSVTLSIFNRMKVLIKAVCCVAPSLAQPWHATMGSAIWLAICQHRSTRRGGGGRRGAVHHACRFAALRAFQMAVIYEPLRMVGLMNATRHVFGMEGPCSAITPSLRRGSRTLHHKY